MVAKRQEMEKEGESFNVNANHYKGVAEIEIPREILAKEYYPKARALMNSWLKKGGRTEKRRRFAAGF